MKVLAYIFFFIFGFMGILSVARIVEALATGGGIQPARILIALVFLLLAGALLKKARRRK
ncbi:MAG: hypothetical protein ACO1QB_10620 [Verrucomicrobiales bacterium]